MKKLFALILTPVVAVATDYTMKSRKSTKGRVPVSEYIQYYKLKL